MTFESTTQDLVFSMSF